MAEPRLAPEAVGGDADGDVEHEPRGGESLVDEGWSGVRGAA